MKKKGFTLIELLAVIVILAIMALIATPTILGVIEKAKKGAAQSSVLGYIDAVEKQIAINLLNNTKQNILDSTYSVDELTNLGVSIKGTLPTGNVTISNGLVKDYILGINGYIVENGVTTKSTNTKKYDNGYTIYYNPVTGEVCSDYVEENSINETKVGCMKWYVYNDKEGNATVNMILDHNTTASIRWNNDNINVAYAESNIKSIVDKLVTDSKWIKTPRLITAYEVAKITNNTSWTNKSSWYYLDSNSKTLLPKVQGDSKYAWLFDYTKECTKYGCNIEDSSNYGYWTSTVYGEPDKENSVWYIRCSAGLFYYNADFYFHGVRPVITISKDLIK